MLINTWYVACDAVDVPHDKPKHVRMLGHDFALFRDSGGKINCVSDICVHRGASLSHGRLHNGCIECPYHGWRYRGDGSCAEIPAHPDARVPKRVRVDAYPVEERYGWVWVFLGDLPAAQRPPIPDVPEYNDPQRRPVRGTFLWKANYGRVVENGVDFGHAAFVHPSFGDRNRPEVMNHQMVESEWSAKASIAMRPPAYRGLWKYIRRTERENVTASPEWHIGGLCIVLRIQITPKWANVLIDVNTPIDESTTLTHWILLRNFFTSKFFDKDTTRRNLKIFEQDQEVIGRLSPMELPMRVQDEYSVQSDAMMVAFRKKRAELYRRGWGLDSKLYSDTMKDTKAAVIPSPARGEDPKGWVFPEAPRLAMTDDDLRIAAE
jgi:phenylpropionate dioxygenase-like ring-hydroxylating dioxygenase large terminal subunit